MLVSIIIPVKNEENYIEDCINSILSGLKFLSKSEKEVLIVDGGSTDKTLEKILFFTTKFNFIKFFKNSKKTAPAALNIGIKKSSGKYIIRCDAHAYYPKSYFKECLKLVQKSDNNVMNVGGVVQTKNKSKTLIAETISLILSSHIGVGNSIFRTIFNNKNKNLIMETHTVPFGCYKREIFKKIGMFNENEPGNEDLEFNSRIIQNGFKILLSQRIFSIYFSREELQPLISQSYNNGFIVTKPKEIYFHKIRHYVPLIFFIFFIIFILNFFSLKNEYINLLSIFFFSFYLFIILLGSVINTLRSKKLTIFITSFFLFFILHFFYGLGSFIGLFNFSHGNKIFNNYDNFVKKVFPLENPFLRKHNDFLTNLIKLISLRISYIFNKFNISANAVDYFSAIILLLGFFLFYKFLNKNDNIFLIAASYLIFGLVMFLDFIDGNLARTKKALFFGDLIDNFNPDILRFFLILLPGFFTENKAVLILLFFSAMSQLIIYYKVKEKILIYYKNFLKIYILFHGLRFLYLTLSPIIIILYLNNYFFLDLLINILSMIYFLLNFILFFLSSKIKF